MTIHKQMSDIPVNPDSIAQNITHTPVNVILPSRLPHRDDNVWIASPVKATNNDH